MKKNCLLLCILAVHAYAYGLDETMLDKYADDISKQVLPQELEEQTLEEAVKSYLEEPEPKKAVPFENYRSTLEHFVFAKTEQYADTPFEEINPKEQALINGSEYLLAIMYITGLGGYMFPDDGVRMLEKLIKRISTKNDIAFIQEGSFIKNCDYLLNRALDYADNTFEVKFAQALLYSISDNPYEDYQAAELLREIVYSAEEVDNALRNKARALLAKLLLKINDQANAHTVYALLSDISTDDYNSAGVFPEDANYAKETMNQLFPPITYAYEDPYTDTLSPVEVPSIFTAESAAPPSTT